MTLTAEQLAARKGKLTASRIAPLMTGDAAKIMRLYKEMTGEEGEENLDDVWAVQLGACTERLQLDWYERKSRNLVVWRGEVVVSAGFVWAAATLDGWDATLKCPIECKHVGGYEPEEVIVDRYQPQLQWQMMCTGAQQCALSVIKGAAEPVVSFVPRHQGYIDEEVRRGEHFMFCVDMRIPPVDIAPAPPPIDPKKIINMTGNNHWAAAANDWLETKQQAGEFEEAKERIKSLVPADAARAFGHGIRVTRDRRRYLHIREEDT